MGVKEKIIGALVPALGVEYARLEDDDGVSGFVVSRQFAGMSGLDRQDKIEAALRRASLSEDERRQILMIAGVTPEEYDAVGAKIQIQRVREMAGGAIEIVLHGRPSDAEYVRRTLKNENGVRTTEPKQVPGAVGVSMSFRAKTAAGSPLTREKAIRVLKNDPYIEILSRA